MRTLLLAILAFVTVAAPATASDASAAKWLALAHMQPDTLAAAGVGPAAAGRVLDLAAEHLQTRGATLDAAQTTVLDSRRTVARLRALTMSGRATPAEREALAMAETGLAQAQAQFDTSINQLFAAATSELPAAARDTLAAISESSSRAVPLPLRVQHRDESDWRALESAMASINAARRLGETPPASSTNLLDAAMASPAAAAAQANLASYALPNRRLWLERVDR